MASVATAYSFRTMAFLKAMGNSALYKQLKKLNLVAQGEQQDSDMNTTFDKIADKRISYNTYKEFSCVVCEDKETNKAIGWALMMPIKETEYKYKDPCGPGDKTTWLSYKPFGSYYTKTGKKRLAIKTEFYVLPKYRGNGIGRRLLTLALKRVKRSNGIMKVIPWNAVSSNFFDATEGKSRFIKG